MRCATGWTHGRSGASGVVVRRYRQGQNWSNVVREPLPSVAGSVAVAEASISYEITGLGPPLVLIHGSWLDRRLWDGEVAALSEHYQVIRYDARGHGQSYSAVVPYAHHRDLHALLLALDIQRVAIVGLSMGGRVAQHFALAYPEMVTALVIVGAAATGATVTPELVAGRASLAAALSQGAIAEAVEQFLRLWVDGPHRTPVQVPPVVRQHARVQALTALEHPSLDGLDEAYTLPTAAQLGTIEVPTLVLVGALDQAYMVESAGLLARHIPGAELVIIDGAGHLVNLEQPVAFTRRILEFLTMW